MKKDKKWLSIIIAILLVVLISLLAISILDFIIPFSRNTKGIEQSSVAYYQAYSALEDALFYMNSDSYEVWDNASVTGIGNRTYSYEISAIGSRLPPIWKWNSEFDNDWNKIRLGEPIQLEVGSDRVNRWQAEFYFRVPDLDNDSSTSEILNGSSTPILNWSLSSGDANLNSKNDHYITEDDICDSNESCGDGDNEISFGWKRWILLSDEEESVTNFYNTHCDDSWEKCSLKISIVNDLSTQNETSIPYLEWYIDFGSQMVPLRYSNVWVSGKSYGFTKNLDIRIPQQTTSEAFDFTIFQ